MSDRDHGSFGDGCHLLPRVTRRESRRNRNADSIHPCSGKQIL